MVDEEGQEELRVEVEEGGGGAEVLDDEGPLCWVEERLHELVPCGRGAPIRGLLELVDRFEHALDGGAEDVSRFVVREDVEAPCR